MAQRVNRNVEFVTDDDGLLVGYQASPGDVRHIAQLATDAYGSRLLGLDSQGVSRRQWETVFCSGAAVQVTGTTAETATHQILIPGGYLEANSRIRIVFAGRIQAVGDATNKSFFMRFGDTTGLGAATAFYQVGDTVVDTMHAEANLFCRGTNAQVGGLRNAYAGMGRTNSAADLVAMTYDTSADRMLYISVKPGHASDIMNIEALHVEVLR